MIRVVYASRPTGRTQTELDDIVNISARNNARSGITGVLLFDDDYYLQILEGPEEAVDALLETLKQDPRHTDMSVVFRTRIESTSFSEWSMQLMENDAAQNPVLSPYATGNRIEPRSLMSTDLDALARDLYKYF